MVKLVKLQEILNAEYVKQDGDYIQVTSVWCSRIPDKKEEQKRCRVILTDGEAYISGVVFLNDGKNTDARNVCRLLQDKSCQYMIFNFKVTSKEQWRGFRHQPQEITLSSSTKDVKKVLQTGDNCQSSRQPIPFQFTELDKIDECAIDELVDVIGYTREISKVKEAQHDKSTKYRTITLSSSRSRDTNKAGFERDIGLFGESLMESLRKNTVYAFLNIKVGEWERYGSGIKKKSLQTTTTTAIFEIRNLTEIPLNYQQEAFILKLLSKRTRSSPRQNRTGSENLPSPELIPILEAPSPSQVLENVEQSTSQIQLTQQSPKPSNSTNSIEQIPHPLDLSNTSTQAMEQSVDTTLLSTPATPGTLDFRTPIPREHIGSSSTNNLSSISCERSVPNTPETTTLILPILEPSSSPSSDPANLGQVDSNSCSEESTSTQNAKRQKLSSPDDASFPDYTYDFIVNEKPLDVRNDTILSKAFMDESPNTYRMRSNPRGIALVINNSFFPGRSESYRKGCDLDVEHLLEILKIFKFEITLKQNISTERIPRILEDFKKSANKNMDACFVAIPTHGCQGLVEMVDGDYVRLSNDVIHQFDKNTFPVFAGKPKIFVIQACQDFPNDPEVLRRVRSTMPRRQGKLELENIIEIYPSPFGTPALRDTILGSHFIYILVDIFMKHSHNTDLETMLSHVQYCLQHKRNQDQESKLHCVWVKHAFNKKLFFNPGLNS